MMTSEDIRQMISTATIGDGDQLLNMIERICDKLDELDHCMALAGHDCDGKALFKVRGSGKRNRKPKHGTI